MKNKVLTIAGILAILLTIVGLTYAYFTAQAGGTTSVNATVTSNTTDLLTFTINQDISFTVTQAGFASGGQNQSGQAIATAILTPNNKTGAATMNYYLYLNITSNPIVYSSTNTNQDPELMLQVFDGSNQLVTLTGLGTQKTIKGVTGYDITGVRGLKTLLNNHAISASNNQSTTESWKVVITLINLDVDQNDNTGKTVIANIIIRQDEMSAGLTGTIYRNNINNVLNGDSIVAVSGTRWCDIETATGDQYNCFNDQSTCEQFLIDEGFTDTDTCKQITGTFGGIGNYETNVSIIRENYNYYLKHQVEENIIEDTEVCLWYNNHEFCLSQNYWDTNGATTEAKLQAAMETALYTQARSCASSSDNAGCSFGNLGCNVNSDGSASCGGVYNCTIGGNNSGCQ